MELTKKQINITKGVAILFMILLHLFCTKDYQNLFTPIIMIGQTPLIYYIALFGDCCVAIYCFCSGYGLLIGYKNNKKEYNKKNIIRILKLLINYWIIHLLFVIILGALLGKSNEYPGNLQTLILSITAINPAYNGAWWFVTTYILLVLISPYINKIVIKYNAHIILFISFVLYFIAYIQRIKTPIILDNEILNWAIRQIALLGTSQLPYLIGVIFAHKKIYSKINITLSNVKFKNILCISGILAMIVAHGFVQTLFIAPFTGIVFICLFNLIEKYNWIDKTLLYLSEHSTNMWLTHMFFYLIYFKELVYSPKYSILIFAWLVFLCLISSYLIKLIYNPIVNKIDKCIYKHNLNKQNIDNKLQKTHKLI